MSFIPTNKLYHRRWTIAYIWKKEHNRTVLRDEKYGSPKSSCKLVFRDFHSINAKSGQEKGKSRHTTIRSFIAETARHHSRCKDTYTVCPVICLSIRFATFHLPPILFTPARSFRSPLFYFYSRSTAVAAARSCKARRVLVRACPENCVAPLFVFYLLFCCPKTNI